MSYCATGLSLKSQELTALFLAARLCCIFVIEQGIHTILDIATLVSTFWVIYMIRFKLKSSYLEEPDNMPRYKLVVPSLVLAILVHTANAVFNISKYFWAFSVYLESVAVFPQLRVMQNAQVWWMVEPLTSHYVFALGVAKFLGDAYWVIDSRGDLLYNMGSGFLWNAATLLSEVVHAFILANFCYYYVRSKMYDQILSRLPSVA